MARTGLRGQGRASGGATQLIAVPSQQGYPPLATPWVFACHCRVGRRPLSFIIKIYDAILRSHLENILYIGGGACSGKTNLTDLIAEQHRFVANHSEQFYQQHKDLAWAENQAKTH